MTVVRRTQVHVECRSGFIAAVRGGLRGGRDRPRQRARVHRALGAEQAHRRHRGDLQDPAAGAQQARRGADPGRAGPAAPRPAADARHGTPAGRAERVRGRGARACAHPRQRVLDHGVPARGELRVPARQRTYPGGHRGALQPGRGARRGRGQCRSRHLPQIHGQRRSGVHSLPPGPPGRAGQRQASAGRTDQHRLRRDARLRAPRPVRLRHAECLHAALG